MRNSVSQSADTYMSMDPHIRSPILLWLSVLHLAGLRHFHARTYHIMFDGNVSQGFPIPIARYQDLVRNMQQPIVRSHSHRNRQLLPGQRVGRLYS